MTDDIRTDFTLCRCCELCRFGVFAITAGSWGTCTLAKTTGISEETPKVHRLNVCGAHLWKPTGARTHKIIVESHAKLPEDML